MASIIFFESAPASLAREECDNIAKDLLGPDSRPVAWQGANSYTLQSDQRIIQFRSDKEILDERIVALAKEIHQSIVPTSRLLRVFPEASASVWIMDKMPGTMIIQSVACEQFTPKVQSRAVSGLARFFADAWTHPQPCDHVWIADTEQRLTQLEAQLPTECQEWVRHSRASLPDILNLPWVLTHSDLSDSNLLVDPQSGELTGVVDWGCAFVSPFGNALWGVESLLGAWKRDGFNFTYDDHEKARSLFAQVFKDSVATDLSAATCDTIEASRILGILLRYGFKWHPEGYKVITKDKEGGSKDFQALQKLLRTMLF